MAIKICKVPEYPRLFEKVRELRAASMLSGPGTFLWNMLGNVVNFHLNPVRTSLAAAWDVLPSAAMKIAKGESGRERFLGEGLFEIMGMYSSMPTALRSYANDLRAVRELPKSSLGKVGEWTTQLPFKALQWADDWAFNKAFAGGAYKNAYRQAVKEGSRGWGAINKRIGEILTDESSRAALTRQAAEAVAAGKAAKVGKALTEADIRKVLRVYAQAMPSELINDSKLVAEQAIFVAKEGKVLDDAIDMVDQLDKQMGGFVSAVLPFRRTPANIARETYRNSPLGLITPLMRVAGAVQKGVPLSGIRGQVMDEMGKATLGTAAVYGLMQLVDSGLIKSAPYYEGQTPAERLTREALGKFPDSVIVGNYAIDIGKLAPLGGLLQSVLSGKAVYDKWRSKNGSASELEGTVKLMESVAQQVTLNMGAWAEPFADFFEAWKSEQGMKEYASRFGASFVPGILKQTRTLFGQQPQTQVPEDLSLLEAPIHGFVTALVPETGAKRLGTFGEERKARFPGAAVLKSDPLLEEMERLSVWKGRPDTAIEDVDLTGEDEDVFARAKGALQRKFMQQAFQSGAYARLSDEQRKAILNRKYTAASRIVNRRVELAKKAGKTLTVGELIRGF